MSKPKIEAIYPLTFMQQALLFHHIHASHDQGFLHVQCMLQGKLEPALLEEAFVKTVHRHPSLRASIHWERIKKPVQTVHPVASIPLAHHDWRSFQEEEQTTKLETLKATDRDQGFDLSTVPLSRLALVRLRDDEYCLLWSCHHILLDGWSAAIILKDTLAYYDGLCTGIESLPEELPGYRAFLNWLQSQDAERPKAFWKEVLADFDTPTLLGSRLTVNGSTGSMRDHVFTLTADSTVQLQAYARRHRLTLNTVIQGVWAILMGSYLHRSDVVFGTTVSGRSAAIPNLELMTGLFTNVLPVRARIRPEMPVVHWLLDLQQKQMEARNFEYVSLDQIVTWTNWPGTHPLFDTLLIMENFPWSDLKGGNIRLHGFTGGFTSTYPISLIVKPGEQFEFQVRYQHHKITDDAVRWLTDNFRLLMNSIADPSIALVSQAEALVERSDLKSEGAKAASKVGKNGLDQDLKVGEYVAPRNTSELKLAEIFEEIFGRHPVGITEDFFHLGGSSLLAVRLFTQIEKKLGRNLPPAALLQHRTIQSLAQILKDDDLQTWDSLVPIRASGTRPPLFCVHAGGAHVLFYHSLARHLGADQPVYALQPTGLDGRGAYHTSVEEMSSHYLEGIRKVQPQGPYALLGTCFGNAVCLEMARQLRAAGQSVSLLAIIDSGVLNQDVMSTPTPIEQLQRIPLRYQRFFDRFRKDAGKAILGIFRARITRLRIAMEKRFNFLRSRQTQRLYKVQKHLLQLHLQYDWQPFEGTVTLIRSTESTENPNLDYHVSQWSKLASAGVNVFVVPGHHETLFEEPEVEGLAEQLKKCLAGNEEKIPI